MQYVILVSGQPLAFACLSSAAEATQTSLVCSDGTYHFDTHDDAVRVRIDSPYSDLSDWEDEPERLARLKQLGTAAHVYAVHYKDVNRLKAILVALARCSNFILDDDFDIFVSGSEFVELSEAHPNGNRWWLGGQYA